jgi:hypothetical protein
LLFAWHADGGFPELAAATCFWGESELGAWLGLGWQSGEGFSVSTAPDGRPEPAGELLMSAVVVCEEKGDAADVCMSR